VKRPGDREGRRASTSSNVRRGSGIGGCGSPVAAPRATITSCISPWIAKESDDEQCRMTDHRRRRDRDRLEGMTIVKKIFEASLSQQVAQHARSPVLIAPPPR
jgi:hypothetical protein